MQFRILLSASYLLLVVNADTLFDDSNWSSAEQDFAETLPLPSDQTTESDPSWFVTDKSDVDQMAGADATLFALDAGGQMGGVDPVLSPTDGLSLYPPFGGDSSLFSIDDNGLNSALEEDSSLFPTEDTEFGQLAETDSSTFLADNDITCDTEANDIQSLNKLRRGSTCSTGSARRIKKRPPPPPQGPDNDPLNFKAFLDQVAGPKPFPETLEICPRERFGTSNKAGCLLIGLTTAVVQGRKATLYDVYPCTSLVPSFVSSRGF